MTMIGELRSNLHMFELENEACELLKARTAKLVSGITYVTEVHISDDK